MKVTDHQQFINQIHALAIEETFEMIEREELNNIMKMSRFVPHMTMQECSQLSINDKIDHWCVDSVLTVRIVCIACLLSCSLCNFLMFHKQ